MINLILGTVTPLGLPTVDPASLLSYVGDFWVFIAGILAVGISLGIVRRLAGVAKHFIR